MSYTKGDVYLYNNGGYWVCHECKLFGPRPIPATPVFETRLEAVDHLREHLKAGHNVEPRAFVRLWREIELNKDNILGYEHRTNPK
jgi:hypothetical protein